MSRDFQTPEAMIETSLSDWRVCREAERLLHALFSVVQVQYVDDKELTSAFNTIVSRIKTRAADALQQAMFLSAGDLRKKGLRDSVDGAILEHLARSWPGSYYYQELGPVDWPAMMCITRVQADLLKKLKHKTSGRAYTEWRVREAIERTTTEITGTLTRAHQKEVSELRAQIQELERRLAALDPLEQLGRIK